MRDVLQSVETPPEVARSPRIHHSLADSPSSPEPRFPRRMTIGVGRRGSLQSLEASSTHTENQTRRGSAPLAGTPSPQRRGPVQGPRTRMVGRDQDSPGETSRKPPTPGPTEPTSSPWPSVQQRPGRTAPRPLSPLISFFSEKSPDRAKEEPAASDRTARLASSTSYSLSHLDVDISNDGDTGDDEFELNHLMAWPSASHGPVHASPQPSPPRRRAVEREPSSPTYEIITSEPRDSRAEMTSAHSPRILLPRPPGLEATIPKFDSTGTAQAQDLTRQGLGVCPLCGSRLPRAMPLVNPSTVPKDHNELATHQREDDGEPSEQEVKEKSSGSQWSRQGGIRANRPPRFTPQPSEHSPQGLQLPMQFLYPSLPGQFPRPPLSGSPIEELDEEYRREHPIDGVPRTEQNPRSKDQSSRGRTPPRNTSNSTRPATYAKNYIIVSDNSAENRLGPPNRPAQKSAQRRPSDVSLFGISRGFLSATKSRSRLPVRSTQRGPPSATTSSISGSIDPFEEMESSFGNSASKSRRLHTLRLPERHKSYKKDASTPALKKREIEARKSEVEEVIQRQREKLERAQEIVHRAILQDELLRSGAAAIIHRGFQESDHGRSSASSR